MIKNRCYDVRSKIFRRNVRNTETKCHRYIEIFPVKDASCFYLENTKMTDTDTDTFLNNNPDTFFQE